MKDIKTIKTTIHYKYYYMPRPLPRADPRSVNGSYGIEIMYKIKDKINGISNLKSKPKINLFIEIISNPLFVKVGCFCNFQIKHPHGLLFTPLLQKVGCFCDNNVAILKIRN